MSKKNLDKLFQEKFLGFEEVPDEKVWKTIEASLDKKKKSRKVIPIWWKLGGVAAILAILFYVVNPFSGNDVPDTIITDVESTQVPNIQESSEAQSKNAVEGETGISEEENSMDIPNGNSAPSYATTDEAPANTSNRANVVEMDKEGATVQNNAVAINNEPAKQDVQNSLDQLNRESLDMLQENETAQNAIANTEKDSKNILEGMKENEAVSEKAIAQTDVENPTNELEKKSIFDEIKESEEEVVAENSSGKWAVGPSVAPIYFNGMGNGSPIDAAFASNSKSGDISLSYGLNVSYDINKKLSIRSGIHKVDYGYNTNDIAFSSTLSSLANDIDHIDYASDSRNIVVESALDPKSSFNDTSKDIVSPQNVALNGTMLQQFEYLELPVELKYALVDKKLGVNLIGGVSSLFLMNNSVTLESNGLATEVGEANNVNSVNFSTNVGFGVTYKLTPKTQFNIEPMFKYHLNTFSDTSGSFQPYSIGVYSGIKLKF